MTAAEILAMLASAATIGVVLLTTRKVWWAPAFGLAHQALWLAFALASDGGWPLIGAVAVHSVMYAAAIPKWYRERPGMPVPGRPRDIGR